MGDNPIIRSVLGVVTGGTSEVGFQAKDAASGKFNPDGVVGAAALPMGPGGSIKSALGLPGAIGAEMSKDGPMPPPPGTLPNPTNSADALNEAENVARRRSGTQTNYTSPGGLGTTDPRNLYRRTLMGGPVSGALGA